MDNRNNNSSGGGFLFGMLIGGALVFLVGTNKGRRILKSLTEEGFEGLSDIIEKAGEEIEEEEEISAPRVRKARVVEEAEPAPVSNGVKSNGHTAPAPKRRFFRRSKS